MKKLWLFFFGPRTCGNCRFRHEMQVFVDEAKNTALVHYCRRSPPQRTVFQGDRVNSNFPAVSPELTCGEHRRRWFR